MTVCEHRNLAPITNTYQWRNYLDMKKIISMVVMLAISLFVVVSPVNAVELEKVIVAKDVFGCVHEDIYIKIMDDAVNDNRDAFFGGLFRAILSDECVMLETGKVVFSTDTDASGSLSLIRPKGSMNKYWLYTNATMEK